MATIRPIDKWAGPQPDYYAPQSRQDRAGDAQPHPDTIALYQRQIRDLEAELEAANGYIRSLESRCAMQARQLGYG